ncbi:site-specific integrase [Pandoraea anhela]|uniref:Integrase n=1 Tax=Pandoraea anhela TaxID=2508295 RepID=A0A5E4Z8F0_9BURK|nr:site-specific integrase [Pandoraea anhela]VVE57439.1 hypothetical protein PAN31108_05200 [Pandoraea anhela]
MLNRPQLPDLTFPGIKFGRRETPWDLAVLLYRGGASTRADLVNNQIACGALGAPELERLELVSALHEEINTALAGGNSRETAADQIKTVRNLFSFAESESLSLTMSTIEETYCAWGDFLLHRTRLKKKYPAKNVPDGQRRLACRSAYNYAAIVGTLLDRALQRRTRIIELTRIEWKSRRKSAVGVQAEKQSLSDTFVLGHMLQDICDSLPKSVVIDATRPLEITLRNGNSFSAGRLTPSPTDHDAILEAGNPNFLANLRIEAELMMFIGQTAMNATEACRLTLRRFSYVSHHDGYQVSEYKRRGSRTVFFEIFKEYKSHLERYLEWRKALFPESELMFPFIRFGSLPGSRCDMARIRAVCEKLNITFIGPRLLRNTRVNWMLRRTGDPDVTAETSQHTKRTLLRDYHKPSQQRAMTEVTIFWAALDSHLVKKESVAPGECTGTPKEEASIAKQAPRPNCARKSGCLWCMSHRDIDTFDYVWALASFCQIKLHEVSKVDMRKFVDDSPPAQLAVERIQEKLAWFEESSEERREWVIEALTCPLQTGPAGF